MSSSLPLPDLLDRDLSVPLFPLLVPARYGSWSLSDAAPFQDTVKESLFASASTLAFLRRTSAIFFVFGACISCLTLQLHSFYDSIFIPVVHLLIALWMVALASISMSPAVPKQHACAIERAVEVTLVTFVPTFILTTPSVLNLSTFLAMGLVRRDTVTRLPPLYTPLL